MNIRLSSLYHKGLSTSDTHLMQAKLKLVRNLLPCTGAMNFLLNVREVIRVLRIAFFGAFINQTARVQELLLNGLSTVGTAPLRFFSPAMRNFLDLFSACD